MITKTIGVSRCENP